MLLTQNQTSLMKHYSKKLNVFLYICLALFAYSCSEENDFIKKKKIDFAIKEKSFKEALGMPLFTNAYSKLAQKQLHQPIQSWLERLLKSNLDL